MKLLNYQQAFGAWDKTTEPMREAIDKWFSLYYSTDVTDKADPCQRIPYTVVNKVVKAVFGEYSAGVSDPFYAALLKKLDSHRREALELALVGGECYLKPCPEEEGFSFTVIPRNNVLIFARNGAGEITDVGMVEKTVHDRYYYTLLERRTLDGSGCLTLQNRLFRSLNAQTLGTQVGLGTVDAYRELPEQYTYPEPLHSVGLVRVKTPMLNCVDGSLDGVSIYAAAVGLIENINRNEAQLCGEFDRGESRIITSRDLLDRDGSLSEHLFLGLDDDPEQVGFHIFSPQLREKSFLERKQEYLRNVESMIGLKRGMLADVNLALRTATEIAASEAEYNLTVIDFQRMWQSALEQVLQLCSKLAAIYGLSRSEPPVLQVDWGNGVLYDEDKLWQQYLEMVNQGMLAPEVALGWRFNMPAETRQQRDAIRGKYMPAAAENLP